MPPKENGRLLAAEDLGKRTFALLRFVVSVSRRRAFLSTLFVLLGSFSEGVSLILLLPLLQFMGSHKTGAKLSFTTGPLAPIFGTSVSIDLALVLLIFVILVCISAFFSRYKTIYMADLLLETINKIRMDLFRSITSARWPAVARLRIADLDHLLTGDIDRVQVAATSLFLVTQSLVFLIGYVILSSLMSLTMTIFAALAGGFMFLALRSVRRRGALFGDRLTLERQAQYRTISDFLAGLKVTKSFNGENRYLNQLQETLENIRKQTLAFVRLNSLGGTLFQCLSVAVGCAFIYVSYAVYRLEFTKIIVLLLIFTRVAPRFSDIQDQFQTIVVNLPAFEAMQRTKALCDKEFESPNPASPTQNVSLLKAMRFESVSFAYGQDTVLKSVSFTVPFGHITALVGQSGSGKSTIADLAMGLQVVGTGQVLIDSLTLDEDTRKAWRNRVAYVPQDTFMLAASVADNLRLGDPKATSEDMWDALKLAHANGFVESLPNGLETAVGDGGLTLSGGERQRIALARALLRKPQLLILDEATSALDKENTERVIDTLLSLQGKTTILLITHNPVVAACAGQVITLESGQIVSTQT